MRSRHARNGSQLDSDEGEIQSPVISSSNEYHPRIVIPDRTLPNYHYPHECWRRRHIPTSEVEIVHSKLSTRTSLSIVVVIFSLSLLTLGMVYMHFPTLDLNERKHIKIPLNIEDAKNLGLVLHRYKDKYFLDVFTGVVLVYIFLQTFAIPGSLFLSILSGYLFSFPTALLTVCLCSALGASLCFFLSHLLGRKFIKRFFPQKAATWAESVEKHKDNLLNYIIFLRITPFLPNWFINLVAPVIGVPLIPFALGTFIGVAPPSVVAIQAGQTLHTMSSSQDAWSWTSVSLLSLFALLSLIPVLLKHRLRQKFE